VEVPNNRSQAISDRFGKRRKTMIRTNSRLALCTLLSALVLSVIFTTAPGVTMADSAMKAENEQMMGGETMMKDSENMMADTTQMMEDKSMMDDSGSMKEGSGQMMGDETMMKDSEKMMGDDDKMMK
jgi:hypothetical protein